jgi:hypothetical protein
VFFKGRRREGERGTQRERTDLPSVFFKEGRRSERKRGREREVGNRRGEGQGRGTSLPLKIV